MREIKFRQWLGDQFAYWGVNLNECDFVGPSSCNKKNPGNTPHQQFTGLHDKNDKEIYEGDVLVDDDNNYATVEWDKQTASFVINFANELQDAVDLNVWATVVGNIYENPDPLDGNHD